MEEMNKIRERCEIPVEDTWATEDMFASDEVWEEELAKLASVKDVIPTYAGLLGKDPQKLLEYLQQEEELALYSTEPRALIFNTALLAPKSTRSTQGVAVMTMKPKFHLERVAALAETGIVNQSRYRVRSVPAAGALLRSEDSDEKQLELL